MLLTTIFPAFTDYKVLFGFAAGLTSGVDMVLVVVSVLFLFVCLFVCFKINTNIFERMH